MTKLKSFFIISLVFILKNIKLHQKNFKFFYFTVISLVSALKNIQLVKNFDKFFQHNLIKILTFYGVKRK